MRGNYVQILPTPNIGVPRLWFFKRTSNLVLPLACAQVTSINDTFDIVEVSTLPDTFAIGTEIDACAYRPPFNITGETTISDITGTSILLTDPLPDLSIGDYLALDGQTPVPQIPVEYTQVLAQMVVCQVYEIQGYKDKLAAAEKSLEKYQKALLGMISPRVKNKTKIIMPVNGGFLAGNQNRMANFPAGR